jgi:glucosamine--fructose-6-phosphate aminotransferase (isomerizing)
LPVALGATLEAEIREQPDVWERLAASDAAARFARAIGDGDVLFVGSGSSLFMAQLGALALRRRGVHAAALAATEAAFDGNAYRNASVVAISQSGRSLDVLAALDGLRPARLTAITNASDSPLAARADATIALEAGREDAIPATKSVTATALVVLWGAALVAGTSERGPRTLRETAAATRAWLDDPAALATVTAAARRIAEAPSTIVVGAGYGVPIASELALKFKEAAYLHAEGFAAGEFRHGSTAVLDPRCALIGIVDAASRAVVARPLDAAAAAGAARFAIGESFDEVAGLGPATGEAFNTLAWLVTGQLLALFAGRSRGIDGDRPRGLTKVVV